MAAEQRKRRNRLLLLTVVYGLLLLETAASPQPLDRSPGAGALCGALGALAGLQLMHLVGLALGRLGGTAPTLLMVGTGPLLGVRRLGPVSVLVRPYPVVPLQVSYNIVAVPALRLRLLLGGLCRIAVPAALGAGLVLSGAQWERTVGLGLFFAIAVILLGGWRQPGSVAWMVFRVPVADAAVLAAYALDPAELAVQRAVMGGRFGEARAARASITGDRPAGARLRAALDMSEGRYREALDTLAPALVDAAPTEPGEELLTARAALFGLEAGVIPRDEAMAVAGAAIARAGARVPRFLAMSEILATQALLNGRAEDALVLARSGLRRATGLQTRALTLCTLAAAQAVTGDQPGARTTLTRARALAPDLARVAAVDHLITELPLHRERV